MSFAIEEFARIRPYSFHLTSEQNLPSVRRHRRLYPTRELLDRAGRGDLARQHRPHAIFVELDSEQLHIRDQAPLKKGNLAVDSEWTFEDVVELLNERVFFWPGTERGPIPSGERHFMRYAHERVAILRVPTADLLALNALVEPEFCKWNSGAPRWSRGIRPVRSRTTFGLASAVPYRAREVIELTFREPVELPETTLVGPTGTGPWVRL